MRDPTHWVLSSQPALGSALFNPLKSPDMSERLFACTTHGDMVVPSAGLSEFTGGTTQWVTASPIDVINSRRKRRLARRERNGQMQIVMGAIGGVVRSRWRRYGLVTRGRAVRVGYRRRPTLPARTDILGAGA